MIAGGRERGKGIQREIVGERDIHRERERYRERERKREIYREREREIQGEREREREVERDWEGERNSPATLLYPPQSYPATHTCNQSTNRQNRVVLYHETVPT